MELYSLGESKGCGGIIQLKLSNLKYTLEAPKLSRKTYLDCGWLIMAEPSYNVMVQVVNYTGIPKCPYNTPDCSSIRVNNNLFFNYCYNI